MRLTGLKKFKKSWLVAAKEWQEIRRDYFIFAPIIVVPLLMTFLLSFLVITNTRYFSEKTVVMERILQNMPVTYMDRLEGYSNREKVILMPIKMFGIPFFLLIPLMVTSILSADSFAGEKERKTIESLLLAPLTNGQVFWGKLLTSAVPALLASWVSFLIFTVVVSLFVSPYFEKMVFPDLSWVLTLFFVIPELIFVSVGGAVFLSTKLSSTQAAMQANFILTFPVLGILFAQTLGFFLFTRDRIGFVILGLFVVDLLMFAFIQRYLRRESMVG